VDDYVSELAKELSEFNVEIRGMLTTSFTESLNGKSADREFLDHADYVLTTFYDADLVKKFVSAMNQRVIVLSLSLNKEALYEIVSLERNMRVGAILSPPDPAPTIVKNLEYYRDLPAGSIPYAIVTDSAAVRRLRAQPSGGMGWGTAAASFAGWRATMSRQSWQDRFPRSYREIISRPRAARLSCLLCRARTYFAGGAEYGGSEMALM
jgi:hypothetical protein